MSGDEGWKAGLYTGWCSNGLNCLYGSCFPCCAIASAKSSFDGSEFLFNCCCFGPFPALTRNYIRQGYEVKGRIGSSDCFQSICCLPCVATQLLNEVMLRGPKLRSIVSEVESPWIAPKVESSCMGDPCDFCCTFTTSSCEIANVYSQLSGVPFWFAFMPGTPCCINTCQVQHLVRKSYGIGGTDCHSDCARPTLCLLIPGFNCIWFYKEVTSLRAEMAHRGKADNFVHASNNSANFLRATTAATGTRK